MRIIEKMDEEKLRIRKTVAGERAKWVQMRKQTDGKEAKEENEKGRGGGGRDKGKSARHIRALTVASTRFRAMAVLSKK